MLAVELEVDVGDAVGGAVPQADGVAGEGEDIEVVEVTLGEALATVERGEIVDGKTVLLLRLAQFT